MKGGLEALLSGLGVSRFLVLYSKNEKVLTDCKLATFKNKAIVKIRHPGNVALGYPFWARSWLPGEEFKFHMQLTFVVLLAVLEEGGMGKKTITKVMEGKFLRLVKMITLKMKSLAEKGGLLEMAGLFSSKRRVIPTESHRKPSCKGFRLASF